MPFVIDVSVMASWHFADERSSEGAAILARLLDESVVVPGIWWFELRNVVLTGERRQRATSDQGLAFLEFVSTLPIEVARHPDDLNVLALARRHRLSFYDACYVELAQREKMDLSTFDQAMMKAANAEGVTLIGA